MPFVHHPQFSDDVREIPAEKVDEYVEAGWVKVGKADEKKLDSGTVQPARVK